MTCPRCGCTVFTYLRRCAVCGWFIGWGSQPKASSVDNGEQRG